MLGDMFFDLEDELRTELVRLPKSDRIRLRPRARVLTRGDETDGRHQILFVDI